MLGETKTTTDHDEIRQWAEERGGKPARVARPFGQAHDSCLQIDFLHERYNDDIEQISWDDFFSEFDRQNMVLVYQTETEGGRKSCFGRIVTRDKLAQTIIE